MQCTSLHQVHGIFVPCGQCMACRLTRATEWAVRCLHERSGWRHSCFATLTYRDEDLPASGNLDLAEFTKFWKRLRKRVHPRKVRYYGCGEYGELNGRAHYHAIIFGVAPFEKELVKEVWGHGNVFLGTVTMESARYVADYVGKAVAGLRGRAAYEKLVELSKCKVPPFAVMSQGLGRDFVDGHRDQLARLGVVTVKGSPTGMPRYYRQRLAKAGLTLGVEVQVLPDLWVQEGKPSYVPWSEDQAYKYLNQEQRELNLVARKNMRPKGRM